MKFEHWVQVNDPNQPHSIWLNRQQVWLGLVTRAWKPEEFSDAVVDADVREVSRDENITVLQRRLNYGAFEIRDTTSLVDEHHTETWVWADERFERSTLIVSIEEPDAGDVWLKFQYDTEERQTAGQHAPPIELNLISQEQWGEYRKQAYRMNDMDTVQHIRRLCITQGFLHAAVMPTHGKLN